jgi:hypothetical protein
MQVTQLADIGKDQPPAWFSTKAITNILSLKDVIHLYEVTYDCREQCFIIWREDRGLPNMMFRMHSSGLHYYDPRSSEDFSFVSTVESNKLPFTKQQILGAEQAQNLYAGLGFPSNTDFKWMLQSNQIKDCPVSLQDAEVAAWQRRFGDRALPH